MLVDRASLPGSGLKGPGCVLHRQMPLNGLGTPDADHLLEQEPQAWVGQ